jgi:hypothetical protein
MLRRTRTVLGGIIVVTALVQFACSGSVSSPARETSTALPSAMPTEFSTPNLENTSVAQTPTATSASTRSPNPTARPPATATVVVAVAAPTRLPTQTPTRLIPSGPPFLKVTQLDQWAMVMAPVDYTQSPATKSLVFRVKACATCKVSEPEKISDADDGKGIKNVEFVFTKLDAQGNPVIEVYRRTEGNKFYCSFGGGEPDCSVLVFAENPKGWPGKNEPFNGDYKMTVTVRTTQGKGIPPTDVFFSIQVGK